MEKREKKERENSKKKRKKKGQRRDRQWDCLREINSQNGKRKENKKKKSALLARTRKSERALVENKSEEKERVKITKTSSERFKEAAAHECREEREGESERAERKRARGKIWNELFFACLCLVGVFEFFWVGD